MVKKYLRPKVPPEFIEWVEQRRINMQEIANSLGNKKQLSRMQAMKLISKSRGGVELTDEMIKHLKRKIRR